MASYIERGDSLFIPFRNEVSISDSQCRPRMYKSVQNFEKSFPAHNLGNKNIDLVEYGEVKHGEWVEVSNAYGTEWLCDNCKMGVRHYENQPYCSECGAKMNAQ